MSAYEFPVNVLSDSEIGVTYLPTNLATGWLRAPTSNAVAFVYQGFLDEVAQAAGTDLPELMRRLLGAPRELPVEKGRPRGHRRRLQNGRLAGRQDRPRPQG